MRRYALRDDQWDPINDILPGRDHDNQYMMIDAAIARAHQHSAGAQKNTRRKPSADPAAD
jgi:hypothetical protein